MAIELPRFEPLAVDTHEDFARHVKEIVARMNASPEIARLTMVNPIYALEDLGVRLSKEMERHVFETFHNPPAKRRRLAALEQEIRAHLDRLGAPAGLPGTPAESADLVFRKLGLPRCPGDREDHLERERLAAYAHHHPLVRQLVEYHVVRRSGLVFHPRAIYDAYRSGEWRQTWIRTVRFGAQPPAPGPDR